jgi:hypothetical protein
LGDSHVRHHQQNGYSNAPSYALDHCGCGLLIEQPEKPACVPHMKPHLKKRIVAYIENLELVSQKILNLRARLSQDPAAPPDGSG